MISLLRRASHGWISRVFSSRQQRPRLKARPRFARLNLESLEERITPTNWTGAIHDPSVGVPLWTNSSVQVVTGSVNVPFGDTLTVAAGTVVQFDANTSLTIDGTLAVQGASGQTVYFTSYRDNSPLLGTNTAVAGDWRGIQFNSDSTANVLTDMDMNYAGGNGTAAIVDSGAPLSLTGSTIGYSSTVGLRITQSSPTITNDTFQNNTGAAISMDDASNPSISPATFTNNQINGVIVDYGTIAANTIWDNPGVAYVVSSLTVAAGETLTLDAGDLIKASLGYNGLTINGTLSANGTSTQPVIFTSIKDDAAGGDTNNDGSATSPAAGNWNGLYFGAGSTGNVLSYVVVRLRRRRSAGQRPNP